MKEGEAGWGLKNIRLVPLDAEGNPVGNPMSVPVGTFDFTPEVGDVGDDIKLMSEYSGTTEWKMELSDIDIAALWAFFTPMPETDDRVTIEYGGHTIKGHLVYVGVEMVDGKEKHRYDMLDGVFQCGPHDEEGNHIV
jgi:hypothetical protein